MLKISSNVKKAYTLVELSIVLVIISIFLSSGLNIFTNNIVQTKTVNTKEKLNIIYKSLAEYLMKNKKLPCPINLDIAKDTNSNYAFINSNCATVSNTINIGALPARDLGLSSNIAEDDFGNKILYVIDNRLTPSSSTFNATNFSNGTITISNDTSDAIKPVLLLLSFGANSCGSYKTNGVQNKFCDNELDGTDQQENSNNDNIFTTSATNPKFDDIVLTKTYYDFLQELNLTHTQAQAYFK